VVRVPVIEKFWSFELFDTFILEAVYQRESNVGRFTYSIADRRLFEFTDGFRCQWSVLGLLAPDRPPALTLRFVCRGPSPLNR
jgi:hypothetical protein